MEPQAYLMLKHGPVSVTLKPVTVVGPEIGSLIFYKKRGPDNSGVVYVAAGLWKRERDNLRDTETNVLKAVPAVQKLPADDSKFCCVLQKHDDFWVMWSAVAMTTSVHKECNPLTLLLPICRTKSAFWHDGEHCFDQSEWKETLACESDLESHCCQWSKSCWFKSEIPKVQ